MPELPSALPSRQKKASEDWKRLTATSRVDLADRPFPVAMEISFSNASCFGSPLGFTNGGELAPTARPQGMALRRADKEVFERKATYAGV
jgi:hypothetical protein